jgi:hypothetical protein
MSRRSVRFAVGSSAGPRSTIWKLWAQGGDAYLTPATPGPSFKVSFHASGQCHYNLPDHPTAWRKPGLEVPRFLDKWRPTSVGNGVLNPFRIIVPSAELRPASMRANTNKPVVWIPASEAAATIVFLAIAQKDQMNQNLERDIGPHLLATLALSSERSMVAVWARAENPAEAFPEVVARCRGNLATTEVIFRAGSLDRLAPDTRILVPLNAPSGDRAILDVALYDQAA